MLKFFAPGLLLLIAACASSGTNFDPGVASALRMGMDKAEVIAALGKPNQVLTRADSTQTLIWSHASGSVFGMKSKAVALPFSADGKLLSVPAAVE